MMIRRLERRSPRNPVLDWLEQKLLYRNSVSAHEEFARRLERLREGREPRVSVAAAAALHLDRRDRAPGPHHEVHLVVALPPIEQIAFTRGGRVECDLFYWREIGRAH